MKIRLQDYKPRHLIKTIKKPYCNTNKPYILRCQDCKYADEYIPIWIYPMGTPRCSFHHKNISPGMIACKDFELIGRLCR